MDWYTKPISYYNREFAKRFSLYEHPYTGEKITTAQAYLNAVKSQQAGRLITDSNYLSVEQLNTEFADFFSDITPADGLPIRSMDDFLREFDIQETLKMKAVDNSYGRRESTKNETKRYNSCESKVYEESEADEVDCFEELNSLIGLENVKREVKGLVDFIELKRRREAAGLKALPVSLHMVFSGNPGTGKTTVARLLAKIYKEIGILSKGHLVEVDRAGLVSGYVGQTALKTTEVINSAIGGILFIDEAYTLAKDGNDFGQEAIDTILKAMEDHRDDLIVIAAGYPELMNKFISSNPGLKSRFSKFLYFEDYSAEELEQVFLNFCNKYEYELSKDAEIFLKNYMKTLVKEKDDSFANARDVRNFFEQTIRNQASRLMEIDEPTDDQLKNITIGDLKLKFTFMMKL